MTSPVADFLNSALGGLQAGYTFRTGIEDRKRRIASEDDAAQYERARRLREDVAFELDQRVRQAQLDRLQGPQYTEVSAGATLHDPTGRAPDYTAPPQPMRPAAPLVQDWQREGFPSQGAWQQYHKQISRAGSGAAERGTVTPLNRFQERTRLMAPHWGVDPNTGGLKMMPGVSATEADRIVREAELGPQSPENTVGPLRSGYRGGQPTNVPQGSDITAPLRAGGGEVSNYQPNNADLKAIEAITDQVLTEHPDWSDEDIGAEVRRRIGRP